MIYKFRTLEPSTARGCGVWCRFVFYFLFIQPTACGCCVLLCVLRSVHFRGFV